MSNSSDLPKSLKEAISKLENDLKPIVEELKVKVESEVNKTKNQVETEVKQNPWMAIAAVGIVAFILGLIFANKKDEPPK